MPARARRREVELRLSDMSEAHLVLTDALITESLRRAKAASKALEAEIDTEMELDAEASTEAPRNSRNR